MASDHQEEAETRIRAAIHQLLDGPIPDGLHCDVKSLCVLAGVPRPTFYRTYPHLKADFDRQRAAARQAGTQSDPRLAQIERLKGETAQLRERLNTKNAELTELKRFRDEALSRLAAQHDEITNLRRRIPSDSGGIRLLRPELH
jgi:predicted nuclease with TOPRIM domain